MKNNLKKEGNEEKSKEVSKNKSSATTNRIKELRQKFKMTQLEFIKKIEIDSSDVTLSTSMLSKLENGSSPLSLKMAWCIADAFNVSLDWLYGRCDDTSDRANAILAILKRDFDINIDTKTLKMSKSLEKFINELNGIEKARKNMDMPNDVYYLWETKIKNDYNEAIKDEMKNESEDNRLKYVFLEESAYVAEIKELHDKIRTLELQDYTLPPPSMPDGR